MWSRALAGVLLLATPAMAQSPAAAPPPAPGGEAAAVDGDAVVPPIEEVRDPPPPPDAVIEPEADPGDPAAAGDDSARFDDEDDPGADALDDEDAGPETVGDEPEELAVEPVTLERPRAPAFIHPTIPPLSPAPSWSVGAGLALSSGAGGAEVVIEARPVADLWLMASGGGRLLQEGGELLTSTGTGGGPLNQTLTEQFTFGLRAGLGVRYGFRFGERVELSPLMWVRGTLGRGVTSTVSRLLGTAGDPSETTVGSLLLSGTASLGGAAEVHLLEELSLRLTLEAIEGGIGVERSDFGTPAASTFAQDRSIGFVLLPSAGFLLRILF